MKNLFILLALMLACGLVVFWGAYLFAMLLEPVVKGLILELAQLAK